MKKRNLVFLTIIVLLLNGCFKAHTNRGPVIVDLQGKTAHKHELILQSDEAVYLLSLDQAELLNLPFKTGTWLVQAFGYDIDGKLISASDRVKVRIEQGGMVSLLLRGIDPTDLDPLIPQNVKHSWKIRGEVELNWEPTLAKSGKWEVWKRDQDELLWQRIAELSSTETSFIDLEQEACKYAYAVCFRTNAGFSTSALVESSGSSLVELAISWDFEHYFAPVLQDQRISPLALDVKEDFETVCINLIAHFHTEEDFARRGDILAKLGFKLLDEIPLFLVALVEPVADNPITLEEWSNYEDQQLSLEPNWIVAANALALNQETVSWYLDYLRIPQAHQKTQGSQEVRIAVLDSGVDEAEISRSVRFLSGYNFANKNYDTRDDFAGKHGTKISQTISEVIPKVTILPVKVLGNNGKGSEFDVAQGLLFAAGLHDTLHNPSPTHIINMSFGTESVLLRKEVEYLGRHTNIVMVAAAGNYSKAQISYPAAFPEVLAIGTIEPSPFGPQKAYYSHYGSDLDLVAPPSFEAGTSFSTALVSGVAGLILAEGTLLEQVRQVLIDTAIDLGPSGWDEEFGHGMVNAWWAVNELSELTITVKNSLGESLQVNAPLKAKSIAIHLPLDEYIVEAWVNVQDQSQPALGDHFGRSAPLVVLQDQENKVHISLVEVH